jgi:putative Mn2+ efflux pump MntP
MNTHNLTQMDSNDYNAGNGVSLIVGFMLAFTNSVTGWLGQIHIAAEWNSWFQALILGIIGSTATYFTNRFWRYLEKRKNKPDKS